MVSGDDGRGGSSSSSNNSETKGGFSGPTLTLTLTLTLTSRETIFFVQDYNYP